MEESGREEAVEAKKEQKKEKIPKPAATSIKRSAATPAAASPTDSKKRVREEEPLVVVDSVKKAKLKEVSSSPSRPATSASSRKSSSQQSSNTSRSSSSSGTSNPVRAAFRKSIFKVLQTATSSPNFAPVILKEVNKSSAAKEAAKANELRLEGLEDINKLTSKISGNSASNSQDQDGPSIDVVDDSVLHRISEEIEEAWLSKCGGQSGTDDYEDKLRALRYNLKRNTTLIAKLLTKALTAKTLAGMTEEEMAPEEARAALREFRAEDEILRNKAAETEEEKAHEKTMFKLRGKTDDRIIGALPTFVPTANEDDDDLDAPLDKLTSGQPTTENTGEVSMDVDASEKNALKKSGASISAPTTSSDTSRLDLESSKPLIVDTKVDLDLGALESANLDFLKKSTTIEENEEEPVQSPQITPNPYSKSNTAEIEASRGIRSILDEIAMETGGVSHFSRNDDEEIPYEPQLNNNHPSEEAKSSQRGDQRETKKDSKPKSFKILEPGEEDTESSSTIITKAEKSWRGKLSSTEDALEVNVTLRWISGGRVDRVLPRLGISSIDISRKVDLTPIVEYLPKLDASSSRAKCMLIFEPINGDSESIAKYNQMYEILDSKSVSGVVAISGEIAKEKLIREVYVMPRKLADIKSNTSTFPEIPNYDGPATEGILYLCLVTDKKTLETLIANPKPSPTLTPLSPQVSSASGTPPSIPTSTSSVPSVQSGAPFASALGGPLGGQLGGGLRNSAPFVPNEYLGGPAPYQSNNAPTRGQMPLGGAVHHPPGPNNSAYNTSQPVAAFPQHQPYAQPHRQHPPHMQHMPPQHWGPQAAAQMHQRAPAYAPHYAPHAHAHVQPPPPHGYAPHHAPYAPQPFVPAQPKPKHHWKASASFGSINPSPPPHLAQHIPQNASQPNNPHSVAASNFLDTLNGVDLNTLLGPPK